MLHLPMPSSLLLAVGNGKVGARRENELLGAGRREEEARVDGAQPGGLIDAGSQRRLVDDGHDGPRDEVPVLRQLDRDYRLDVQDPDAPFLRAGVEVEV